MPMPPASLSEPPVRPLMQQYHAAFLASGPGSRSRQTRPRCRWYRPGCRWSKPRCQCSRPVCRWSRPGSRWSRPRCRWIRPWCQWSRLGSRWSRPRCRWSRPVCSWSRPGSQWSRPGCLWNRIQPTKYYIYTKSTMVSVPSSEMGHPHPLSSKRVCLPPNQKGGGTH
jgi:hypothetical protein